MENFNKSDTQKGQGTKYDDEKLRYDLVPWDAFEDVVKVITIGAKKYSPNNWREVEPKERYFAAAMRHMVEYYKGVREDVDTGLNPLTHAICSLLFLLWKDKNQEPEFDKLSAEEKRAIVLGDWGIDDIEPSKMAHERLMKGVDIINAAHEKLAEEEGS